MAGYSPLKITGNSTGLVQERENFLLPDDAYPVLQNAYVWRERILRKKGFRLLGRLQRLVDSSATYGAHTITFDAFGDANIITSFVLEPTGSIVPGSVLIIDTTTLVNYTDPARDGTLIPSGTINYATGAINIVAAAGHIGVATFNYYPGLPVMGIRIRELQNSSADETVFFDQKYAYVFNSGTNVFEEFIPGTTWNAAGTGVAGIDFFWSTNYWVSAIPPFSTDNRKLFWVTNNSGHSGANADPPRITDGTTWVDFFPSTWSQIDATNFLTNWLCMLPFRGRMVTFNTWEGPTAASSLNYSNRIRWATIGNPFIPYAAGPPARGSWRDDIRGQGGFLDIPTSEDIVSVGFVRDNLVIYCERSTWQLRYTGRAIAPFQIEKVNSELGTEGTFSAVQFDTSLIGIGDKGIVECDSYKSERIDIKIPDFVFQFNTLNDGVTRVQGIRDFPNRLAYWTIPLSEQYDVKANPNWIFPNTRLVYNYENDSWATFSDSLTALGNYQAQTSANWINTPAPWIKLNFPWISQPEGYPLIAGGNQQGFIGILNEKTVNDASLFISNITANTTTPTVVTSPNHNLQTSQNISMQTNFVIQISGIPTGTPFDNLNNQIFGVVVVDADNFELWKYNAADNEFSIAQLDVPTTDYIGGGLITVKENFSIKSKKFNFLDEGQSIQIGFIDILLSATEPGQPGAIALNVYLDYDDISVSNILPENVINNGLVPSIPDTFFNSVIPTTQSNLSNIEGTKFWQRVFCATRANFLTLEYTFNNAQMVGGEQTKNVQIDAQVLWLRKGGRMSTI